MTKIILGKEKVKELYDQDVFEGYDFEHEGEKYIFVEESDVQMDDDGKSYTYIYKRESDNKYFEVTISYARYGYEDYEFESWLNDGEMYEVEKHEKVITYWKKVK